MCVCVCVCVGGGGGGCGAIKSNYFKCHGKKKKFYRFYTTLETVLSVPMSNWNILKREIAPK